MIVIIHKGKNFEEVRESCQQKRAGFVVREIRSFDVETLHCLIQMVHDSDHNQDDIQAMSEELLETERMLFKLEESRKNGMIAIRDLEQTKERLLSFAEYAKDAQPKVLVTLIQTIVEKIYIVNKEDERFYHIFIKGCTDEDYTSFFQTVGYIEQKTTPVCDSEQYCLCDSPPTWQAL